MTYKFADRNNLVKAERLMDEVICDRELNSDERFRELMGAAMDALYKARAYCWNIYEQED